MSDDSKLCPLCCEAIKPRAKVCPHSHHWQTRWSIYHPHWHVTILALPLILLWIGLGYSVQRTFDRGEDFQFYRGELAIVHSSMHYEATEKGPMISAIGTLTNRGEIPWKEIQLEARYGTERQQPRELPPGQTRST